MIETFYKHKPLPPNLHGDHTKKIKFIAVIATLGGLLFGYDAGIISSAILSNFVFHNANITFLT